MSDEKKANPWLVRAAFHPDGSLDENGAMELTYRGPAPEPDADGWQSYPINITKKEMVASAAEEHRKFLKGRADYEESLKPKYDAVSSEDMWTIEMGLRDLELQPVFTKILQNAVSEKLGDKVKLDRFGRLPGNHHVSTLNVGDMEIADIKKLFKTIGMDLGYSMPQAVMAGRFDPKPDSQPLYHHEIAYTPSVYAGGSGNIICVRTDSLIAALGIDPNTLKPEALKGQTHLVSEGSAADVASSVTKKLMEKLAPAGRVSGRGEDGKPLPDDGPRER